MQGLAVVDGDLVVSGGSLLTLTGPARIKQDLTFALRDQYGADPNHPYWGSILDRYIGQPMTPALKQQVTVEVQRILNNYISVQADQVNAAVANNVRGNLTTADVVRSITSIEVTASMDSFLVTVNLQTMSRDTVTISRVVEI